ncbi:helix-turn-helix domain-containing protein [Massilia sp. NEAU-DD11]|uniref:Helix-turn-helix domain-containing protein n=1 Tax=Massilia cellulosiltytica TaxID=2683234 RepID=A0A7X3G608_9BURK|nr:helix-turn-helix domain-containing protein [Telluria cellulosilytica]
MSVPSFHEGLGTDVPGLRQLIADRVRLERRRKRLTQKEFADFCGVALRTYKRFESGTCDSLEAFLSIIVAFERVVALELLFPPKEAAELKPRGPEAVLGALRARVEREQLDAVRLVDLS